MVAPERLNDLACLRYAAQVALAHSDDPGSKVGVVLFTTSGDVVEGANHYPEGFPHVMERPAKYAYVEHAERTVIYKAAAAGLCTRGAIAYANWAACPDCARAFVAAGVRRVVISEKAIGLTPERWRESVRLGLELLRLGGVAVALLPDPLGVNFRCDGQDHAL